MRARGILQPREYFSGPLLNSRAELEEKKQKHAPSKNPLWLWLFEINGGPCTWPYTTHHSTSLVYCSFEDNPLLHIAGRGRPPGSPGLAPALRSQNKSRLSKTTSRTSSFLQFCALLFTSVAAADADAAASCCCCCWRSFWRPAHARSSARWAECAASCAPCVG